jgi:histone H3/H4
VGEYPELNRATMNHIPIPNIERIVAHATKRGLNFDEAAADLGVSPRRH